MKTISLLTANYLVALVMMGAQNSGDKIPVPYPPQEQAHHLPGVDEPPVVVRGERRPPLNAPEAKQQAEDLAKLAQSIPPDVDKVAKGQLPQDLVARLKQIEKLSKQLRREVSQ